MLITELHEITKQKFIFIFLNKIRGHSFDSSKQFLSKLFFKQFIIIKMRLSVLKNHERKQNRIHKIALKNLEACMTRETFFGFEGKYRTFPFIIKNFNLKLR